MTTPAPRRLADTPLLRGYGLRLGLALAVVVTIVSVSFHRGAFSRAEHRALPDFDLPRLDVADRRLRRADLLGRAVLLNVWGSWCIGCRREHAVLMTLKGSRAVELFGITYRDDPEDARRWLAHLGNPYDAVASDRDGAFAQALGVRGAPETLVIGPDGSIRYRHAGPLTEEIWRDEMLPALERARAR